MNEQFDKIMAEAQKSFVYAICDEASGAAASSAARIPMTPIKTPRAKAGLVVKSNSDNSGRTVAEPEAAVEKVAPENVSDASRQLSESGHKRNCYGHRQFCFEQLQHKIRARGCVRK